MSWSLENFQESSTANTQGTLATVNTGERPPLNLHLLRDSTLKTRMTSTLREQMIPLEEHPCEHTFRQLRTTAKEILGLPQRGRSDWISKRTWDLIRRRNHLKPLADQLTQYREEYRGLCRAVKRSPRKDKRAQQQIARITGTHHKQNKPVRDLEGNLLSNDDAQIRRWRKHFMGISHTTSPNVAIDYRSVVPPSGSSRIPSAPPNVREIVNAIKKLKHNRAAGEDNIPAELLQVDTQLMAEILHPHFSRIWEGETVPASWKSGIIVKLPKKGDLSDCNNWRE
ncbi:uncharacterized protein LOC122756460 [Drosophila santomea]|uniref:uncharacterized protein LOC122756460 n=1 Tax=Drosophila santomea TaxID=129105 RepID=UPI001CD0132E|nr:uncharacterized protein LOC122756460 [Drosophila santomea]